MSSLLDTANLPTLPYPAQTKTATTSILDIPTTAQLTTFSDKLLLTISQHGKLAQWFSVPLGLDNPSVGDGGMMMGGAGGGGSGYSYDELNGGNDDGDSHSDEEGDGEAKGEEESDQLASLLTPQNRFQARTILGGGGGDREVWGGLVARCAAGLVASRKQEFGEVEERVLIVGLGLVGIKFDGGVEEERREVFLRILELVARVL